MSNCPFCNNSRKVFLEGLSYDVNSMYLYEDADFSISPDLCPLICGHLLIIPTVHYASFGSIEDRSIIVRMKQKVMDLIGTSDLLFFEHGAVKEGQGGASIDHAHMHVMPRPIDIDVAFIDNYVTNSKCVFTTKTEATLNTLQKFVKARQPYIYYELQGQAFAYPVRNIPHQFMRLMFESISRINCNWREMYTSELAKNNVNMTLEYIRQIHLEE